MVPSGEKMSFIRIPISDIERAWKGVRERPRRFPYQVNDLIESLRYNEQTYHTVDINLFNEYVMYLHETALLDLEEFSLEGLVGQYARMLYGPLLAICPDMHEPIANLSGGLSKLTDVGAVAATVANVILERLTKLKHEIIESGMCPSSIEPFIHFNKLMIEAGLSLCMMLVEDDNPSILTCLAGFPDRIEFDQGTLH